ncbi:MAG: tetratricopeptide repeat protein [Alphaproteobacteria bacterium]|nr:MAG: tetratricopeptide repeat protein [Alphaproteobacteria bacterium]
MLLSQSRSLCLMAGLALGLWAFAPAGMAGAQAVDTSLPPMIPTPPATLPAGQVGVSATDMESRFSQLEGLVRGLTNQAEQNQFQLTRLQQQMQQLADQVQRLTPPMVGADGVAARPGAGTPQTAAPSTPAAASNRPASPRAAATPPAAPPDLAKDEETDMAGPVPAQSGAPGGQLGTLKYAPGSSEAVGASPPVKGVSAGPPPLGAKEQYDKGMALLRQSQYDEAAAAFDQFLRDNPKHALADQARSWQAEIQYVQGHFDQAAVAFADAYQKAPKSPKAANNLLKLALSLSALGKTKDACDTFSALTAQTPGMDPALRARAREEAKRLKCGKTTAH